MAIVHRVAKELDTTEQLNMRAPEFCSHETSLRL